MKDDVAYLESTTLRSPAFLFRRISWGAVFAGLFVSMVIQLMFTVLGVAIGATVFNPAQQQNPGQGMAIGSAVWLLVTGLISLFIGTFTAGRLSGGPRRADGLLHGIVTWSVSTLVLVFLLASASGAALGGLGALLSGAMQSQSEAGKSRISALGQEIGSVLPNTGPLAPTGRQEEPSNSDGLTSIAAQDPELAGALAKLEAQGGASASANDRDRVVQILTSKHGLKQQQAVNLIDQWHQQIHQQASAAGSAVAKNVSTGAWWAFISLVLGLLVAAWGGWAGTSSIPARIETATVAAP